MISKETSEEPLSKTEFGWWVRCEGFWVGRAGGRCNLWKNVPADTRNTSFVSSFVSSFVISKEASEEPLSKTEFVWWGIGCLNSEKHLPADTRNTSFVSSFVISKETSKEPLSKTEFGWWMRGFGLGVQAEI